MPSISDIPSDRVGGLSDSKPNAALALALLVPVPSLGAAMLLRADAGAVGQALFAAAKVYLALFPLAWLVLVDRGKPVLPRPRWRGMPVAIASGLLMAGVIILTYVLIPDDWIDPGLIARQAREAGFTTPAIYLLGCVFFCLVNAVIEEYVWRWFVFRKCEALLPMAGGLWAVLLTAACFTLHHAIVLAAYFQTPAVVALGSLGVFAGGVIWSALYGRYRSIWAPYVSHILADVAIFAIGYRLIFGGGV